MSSPLARDHKSPIDHALIGAHRRLSHSRRIEILADELARRIAQRVVPSTAHAPRILDVGCGDMTLADAIEQRLGQATVRCVDVHPCPPERLALDPRWQRYTMFDGRRLDFDHQAFDVVMLSDVLHHVNPGDRQALLSSAARVGRFVMVKDHLEHGWISRQVLRAMDVVGNYGYGVPIPERYFDAPGLKDLFRQSGMDVVGFDVGIDLYAHLPVVGRLLSPNWHVIAIGVKQPE